MNVEFPLKLRLGQHLSDYLKNIPSIERTFLQIIGDEPTPNHPNNNDENRVGRFGVYIWDDISYEEKKLYLVGDNGWDIISQLTELGKNEYSGNLSIYDALHPNAVYTGSFHETIYDFMHDLTKV